MILALILFGVAALGGLTLAILRLRGRELPPLWLALVHGLIAASGLVTLILVVAMGMSKSSYASLALVGFLVAAVGGFVLFSFHVRSRALPIPLVFVHGLIAVVSYVTLFLALILV